MTKQPNIIYILSDEHRGQSMSHMGDSNVRTPTLDQLANEGVSFSRAYANCPVCTPSRGTIFSGRHAHAGPVQSFWDVYKPAAPSTAHELRRAGYSTCYIGKWHPGVVRDQVPPVLRERSDEQEKTDYSHMRRTPEDLRGGFEDWFAFETNGGMFDPRYFHQNEINPRQLKGYATDAFTDFAIEYLKERVADKPLFMVLSVVPPPLPSCGTGEVETSGPRGGRAQAKRPGLLRDTPLHREVPGSPKAYGRVLRHDRKPRLEHRPAC